jgi:hypothetical protein
MSFLDNLEIPRVSHHCRACGIDLWLLTAGLGLAVELSEDPATQGMTVVVLQA